MGIEFVGSKSFEYLITLRLGLMNRENQLKFGIVNNIFYPLNNLINLCQGLY